MVAASFAATTASQARNGCGPPNGSVGPLPDSSAVCCCACDVDCVAEVSTHTTRQPSCTCHTNWAVCAVLIAVTIASAVALADCVVSACCAADCTSVVP